MFWLLGFFLALSESLLLSSVRPGTQGARVLTNQYDARQPYTRQFNVTLGQELPGALVRDHLSSPSRVFVEQMGETGVLESGFATRSREHRTEPPADYCSSRFSLRRSIARGSLGRPVAQHH